MCPGAEKHPHGLRKQRQRKCTACTANSNQELISNNDTNDSSKYLTKSACPTGLLPTVHLGLWVFLSAVHHCYSPHWLPQFSTPRDLHTPTCSHSNSVNARPRPRVQQVLLFFLRRSFSAKADIWSSAWAVSHFLVQNQHFKWPNVARWC